MAYQSPTNPSQNSTPSTGNSIAAATAQQAFAARVIAAGGKSVGAITGTSALDPWVALAEEGGGWGMAAAIIGQATFGTVTSFADQREYEEAIRIKNRNDRRMMAHRVERGSDFDSSAESNTAAAEKLKDELLARILARDEFAGKSKFPWMHPTEWMGHLTGASQNPENENEEAINQIGKEIRGLEKNTRYIFEKRGDRAGITMTKKRLAGDNDGADADEETVIWRNKFGEIMRKLGPRGFEEAYGAADDEVKKRRLDRTGEKKAAEAQATMTKAATDALAVARKVEAAVQALAAKLPAPAKPADPAQIQAAKAQAEAQQAQEKARTEAQHAAMGAASYARLVTTRTSAAATARIATLAENQYFHATGHHSVSEVVKAVKDLHQTVHMSHDTARDAAFRKQFTRR